MENWWNWALVVSAGVGVVLLKRYLNGSVFYEKIELSGKCFIITGANCGIGKSTATELCKRGARVILACRDVVKGEEAVKCIRRVTCRGQAVVKELDLASLASVRAFAKMICEEESNIDVLVNNAAVFQCPFEQTDDGFEKQMGVNHLGHFLLTNLLRDKLAESSPSRIVIVSSSLSKRGHLDLQHLNMTSENYDKKAAYNNSKLACNYFARELVRRLKETGVTVYGVSPGMVDSSLGRHVKVPIWVKVLIAPLWFVLVKNCYYGCQTILYCSASENITNDTGSFYRNCAKASWPENVWPCEEEEKELWKLSEKLVNL